jgi:hypothetical protein
VYLLCSFLVCEDWDWWVREDALVGDLLGECWSMLVYGGHVGRGLEGERGDDADCGMVHFGWYLHDVGLVCWVMDGEVDTAVGIVFKVA